LPPCKGSGEDRPARFGRSLFHFAKLNLMQQAQIDRLKSAVVPSQQLLIGGKKHTIVFGRFIDLLRRASVF
jgi:hypothetical protein